MAMRSLDRVRFQFSVDCQFASDCLLAVEEFNENHLVFSVDDMNMNMRMSYEFKSLRLNRQEYLGSWPDAPGVKGPSELTRLISH